MNDLHCPLCGDYIDEEGHSGIPLVNARVWSFCNYTKVIPARVDHIIQTERGRHGK
jgi:hypothetical protein